MTDHAAGFKTVGRGLHCLPVLEFRPAQGDHAAQIGAGGGPFHKTEDLVLLQPKDIAGIIQQAIRLKAFAQFHEDAPDAAKEPGALEAEVFPIPYPKAGVVQNPAKNNSFARTASQGKAYPLLCRQPEADSSIA